MHGMHNLTCWSATHSFNKLVVSPLRPIHFSTSSKPETRLPEGPKQASLRCPIAEILSLAQGPFYFIKAEPSLRRPTQRSQPGRAE